MLVEERERERGLRVSSEMEVDDVTTTLEVHLLELCMCMYTFDFRQLTNE